MQGSSIDFTNSTDIRNVPSHDSNVIEMEPMIHGTTNTPHPLSESEGPHSQIDQKLSAFIHHDVLLIQDDMGDHILITDANGRKIFKCKETNIAGTRQYRGGSFGGTATDFLNDYGQIIFTLERRKMKARVTCGEFLLGKINGDFWGCSRSFDVKSSIDTDNNVYQMNPVGCITGIGFSCINSCCMEEYIIYSPNGIPIGKIKSGESAINLTFVPGMDVKIKALLLAGSLLIYELYFAVCFGRVGMMGSRYIFSCSIIGIILLIGFICFFLLWLPFPTKSRD